MKTVKNYLLIVYLFVRNICYLPVALRGRYLLGKYGPDDQRYIAIAQKIVDFYNRSVYQCYIFNGIDDLELLTVNNLLED